MLIKKKNLGAGLHTETGWLAMNVKLLGTG